MIDVHCHLNFHAYEKNYEELIKSAFEKGVTKIINVGTKLDSSAKAIQLAKEYENLYAIVGIHPHHADKIELGATWLKELEKLATMPKVVAIGEIGMDYYRYQSNGIVDKNLQREIFETQLELAHRLHLPIQIHNRHAGNDVVAILKHHKNLLMRENPGMFHCFAADKDVLQEVLNLGFYIGFDGNSMYPGLAPGETFPLPEAIRFTPLERIVTETDSPFLTPVPYRGTQNKPEYVIIVGEFIASIKGIPFEEINTITTENATRLFDL